MIDVHAARRPDLGHVVAFEGALLHGGDPIVSGERYIIAAFLYATRAGSAHGASAGGADGVDAGARRGTKRGCADASGPAPAGNAGGGPAPFRFNF